LRLPLHQPIRSQLKEFWHGFQVPVGIVDVDVPQVGSQLGEFSFDIEPGAIPPDQSVGSISVSHVMKPWTTAVPLGRYAETEMLGQLGEGVSRSPLCNPATPLRDKECRSG
jgi:hypothetical protein